MGVDMPEETGLDTAIPPIGWQDTDRESPPQVRRQRGRTKKKQPPPATPPPRSSPTRVPGPTSTSSSETCIDGSLTQRWSRQGGSALQPGRGGFLIELQWIRNCAVANHGLVPLCDLARRCPIGGLLCLFFEWRLADEDEFDPPVCRAVLRSVIGRHRPLVRVTGDADTLRVDVRNPPGGNLLVVWPGIGVGV